MLPRILGVIILLQAVSTNYELGFLGILSMKAHLINDYLAGGLLIVSPWLFGFANSPLNMWVPHVLVGVTVITLAAMTEVQSRAPIFTKMTGRILGGESARKI